jgi:hypothetical protein
MKGSLWYIFVWYVRGEPTHLLVYLLEVRWLLLCYMNGLFPSIINIDYYMAFFISYSLSALGHDIWTRADKGYNIKNDMLWSVYHILQQRK